MDTRYLTRILICWFMLMTPISSNVLAFYKPCESSKDLLPQKEEGFVSRNNNKNAFVVYHNLNNAYEIFNIGQMIWPPSDKFVPSDLIPCNTQLRLANRQSETVEISLANLVYANLKLKKLLEEHEALQQRTKEILSGLSVPFLSFQLATFDSTERASIYGSVQVLERSQNAATRHGTSLSLTNVENFSSLHSRSAAGPLYLPSGPSLGGPARGPLYLASGPRARQNNGANQPPSSRRDIDGAPPPEQPLETASDEFTVPLIVEPTQETEEERALRERRNRRGLDTAYEEPIELPWIIMFPIRTGLYFIQHPFEGVFYISLAYFFVMAFQSTRKKR